MSRAMKSFFDKKNPKFSLEEMKVIVELKNDFIKGGYQFGLFTNQNSRLKAVAVVDDNGEMVSGLMVCFINNKRTEDIYLALKGKEEELVTASFKKSSDNDEDTILKKESRFKRIIKGIWNFLFGKTEYKIRNEAMINYLAEMEAKILEASQA